MTWACGCRVEMTVVPCGQHAQSCFCICHGHAAAAASCPHCAACNAVDPFWCAAHGHGHERPHLSSESESF